MTWWGRRKTDPPKPPAPPGAGSEPDVLQSLVRPSNVINFPKRRIMGLEARVKTHKLLDEMIDKMEEGDHIAILVVTEEEA